MILAIDTHRNTRETIRNISSWLACDRLGLPVMVALEYRLPEGTAWTLASADDKDFDKILTTSGILFMEISGNHSGTPGLLCVPMLGKGVPRRVDDVRSFLVSADDGTPFFYAEQTTSGTFQGTYYHEVNFRERVSQ